MLTFKLTDNILEVREDTFSFHNTVTRYAYYDVKHWLRSYIGRQEEIPTVPMTEREIDWVKRHYLSKITRRREVRLHRDTPTEQ